MQRIAEDMTLDELIKKILDQEYELAKEKAFIRIKSLIEDANRTSSVRTNMKLKFRNKISPEILTGEEIRGEGDTLLEVALVDDHTGNTVDVGPEASSRVSFHLLKGGPDASEGDDWTVEEFSQNIIPEVERKRPLLAGNDVTITLQSGIGVVKNIKLRNHASQIRPSEFKLGVRVVGASAGGNRIKEAKTESFIVKDFRNKYGRKHKTPSLSDEVFRLANICRGGIIHRRLQDNQISTVEDFLIGLLKNPVQLKEIVSLGSKKWQETINNARACPSESRMYCYTSILEQEIVGVVFNFLGEVLGLYSQGHYSPTSMLPEKDKADARKLLPSAYENWGSVMPFNDMNSLEQYFTYLSSYMTQQLLDHPAANPDYAAGGLQNAGTSERVEASGVQPNILLNMQATSESGGDDDFGLFSADTREISNQFVGQTGADNWVNTDNLENSYVTNYLQSTSDWISSMLQDVYAHFGQ